MVWIFLWVSVFDLDTEKPNIRYDKVVETHYQ